MAGADETRGRRGPSPAVAPSRSPSRYFALLFLITVPAYALRLVPPWSIVMVVLPLVSASLLTYREAGRDGVRALLGRALDHQKIRDRRWYLPILLLVPAVLAIEYGWLRLTGAPVSPPQVAALVLPGYLLVFLVAAAGEEIGWSGYALDPLQARRGALAAALAIGSAWALWHFVPYALANPPAWFLGQCAATVLLRVLMVWCYNNTGGSVFGMVLFQTTINMATIPDYGFRYDPVPVSAVLAAMVVPVVFLWGPRTLARFRYPRRQGAGGAGARPAQR
jgi:uncharacterized protein